MIGLDSNVLVRFLTQDDPDQAARATALVESRTRRDPGFVSVVVLAEVDWVLRNSYDLSRADAPAVVEGLLGVPELTVQDADLVHRAVERAGQGADLADALIAELGRAAGCSTTLTFDTRATQRAGMTLL